jgi:hypothetical protein
VAVPKSGIVIIDRSLVTSEQLICCLRQIGLIADGLRCGILGLVAEDAAGVLDVPEAAGVVGDAVAKLVRIQEKLQVTLPAPRESGWT